jgi:short-subunit dehydrogenase
MAATTTTHPSPMAGKVAAVTGAGSGIGRSLARALAARGTHLALADVDQHGMDETAAACRAHPVNVTCAALDVSDRVAVHRWADQVVADHARVNLVFNNAGVALSAPVDAMSYEDFHWLMGINFWGVVHGSKAFLPHLKASGDGHIVNISSVFGLISVPTQAAYNSAKFAVRGFTEALRMELEIEGAPVTCTTVHPGGIKTNIARNARIDPSVARLGADPEDARRQFDRMAMTTPDRAARRILAAVEGRRRRVLVGPDAHLIDLMARLPSAVYQNFLVSGARRRR